jgi:hypothetical protein
MNPKVADQSVGDGYEFIRATGLASLLLFASLVLTSKPAAAKPAKNKTAPAARVDALIVGGVDQYNGPMASAEAFNANAGTFSCVGGLNSAGVCNDVLSQPRFAASVAPLPGGRFWLREETVLACFVSIPHRSSTLQPARSPRLAA